MSTDFLTRIFGDGDNSLEVQIRDGKYFFAANEACNKLWMSNPRQALRRLAPGDVVDLGVTSSDTKSTKWVTLEGLFDLIMAARKREAQQFKFWVTHDLLPTLFYTGKYDLGVILNDASLEERSAALGEAVFGTRERTAYHGVYLNHRTRDLSYKIDGNNFPNFQCDMGHLAWKQHSVQPKYYCKTCHAQYGPSAYHNVWFHDAEPTVRIAV